MQRTPPQQREILFYPHTSPTAMTKTNSEDAATLKKLMDELNLSFHEKLGDLKPQLDELKKAHAANMLKIDNIEKHHKEASSANITDISGNINKLEKQMYDLGAEFKQKLGELSRYISDLSSRIDDLDQSRRNKWIVIQGLSEVNEVSPDETVWKMVKEKLEINLPDDNKVRNHVFDEAYRMGKPRSGAEIVKFGPRPILVKFSFKYQMQAVMRAKKKLKNTKIFISESLTPVRLDLLKKAREKFGPRNVWSANGHILVNREGTISRLKSLDDIL
jgi:hypothetical protein